MAFDTKTTNFHLQNSDAKAPKLKQLAGNVPSKI